MPLLSSPVAYPPSSSPPIIPEKRKRSHHLDPSSSPKRRLQAIGDEFRKPQSLFGTLRLPEFKDTVPIEETRQAEVVAKTTGPFLDDLEDSDDDNGVNCVKANDECVRSEVGTFGRVERENEKERPTVDFLVSQDLSDIRPPKATTSIGKQFQISKKKVQPATSYEQLIAARSTTAPGKANRSFYGVPIHDLLHQIAQEPKLPSNHVPLESAILPSVEIPMPKLGQRKRHTMLWTEKYRARKFTDLVGDERTHRDVLRWLKGWDHVVFSGSGKLKPKSKFPEELEERQHKKILLLTGPPGLGKTTLAHVCAKQAGYEVVEINASDERNRDVVKGRIRECVGTENVKGINTKEAGQTTRKAGRPVCLVVDEVDGVVGGNSGGGEGGFFKALVDLALLDQKNSTVLGTASGNAGKTKKKGDRFRLLRPMILICNDLYHPALRPLRSSSMAEIIHIRKPPLDKVAARLKGVFDREGVACDGDGVRRLCEATWGISSRRENKAGASGTGEGDIRGILVVGEWVAAKMRAYAGKSTRLTKKWVEEHVIDNLSHGGGGVRGLGRGGAKEVIDRVFLDGAGFPKVIAPPAAEEFGKTRDGDAIGVSELAKREAMNRLREMVDTSGETDRIITDCFATYPSQPWQDDTLLSKPDAAYDWLHFHDRVSAKVHVGQEWELGPYLSESVLGFHSLFASPAKQSWAGDQNRWDRKEEEEPLPFSGPRADYDASEALKQNRAILQSLQLSVSIPLHRFFKSAEDISVNLLPHLIRMLSPDVKPIVVGGSGDQRGIVSVRKEGERHMVQRTVSIMSAVGVKFERARIESNQNGMSSFVYRMEPPLDTLATFETATADGPITPARYAIRQALDQEHRKYLLRQSADARQARCKTRDGLGPGLDMENESLKDGQSDTNPAIKPVAAKRDFFGRIIENPQAILQNGSEIRSQDHAAGEKQENRKVWVSFHEGFSNAVRKPITLEELMRGF